MSKVFSWRRIGKHLPGLGLVACLLAYAVGTHAQQAIGGTGGLALVPQVEPVLNKAPNRPYMVMGQRYEPMARDMPFKQRGLASWYGHPFHGRRTASGETFDMHALTAAHPTLPIPSYARVTLLRTGRSVIVRINDRGPFHSRRILDLSHGAALRLGMISHGTAEIEVERLTFDDIRTGRWRDGEATAVAVSNTTPPLLLGNSTAAATSTMAAPGQLAPTDDMDALLAMNVAQDPVPSESVALPAAARAHIGASVVSADASDTLPAAAVQGLRSPYWVQLGAFEQIDRATAFRARIRQDLITLGENLFTWQDGGWTKFQIGPYTSALEAARAAQRVRALLQTVPVVVQRQ